MVQIYTVNISHVAHLYDVLFEKASAERQNRADRCRRREDALRCLVSESLLRYAAREQAALHAFAVEYDTYGKPRIRGREDLHFNISHSGSWVVLAWSSGEVGIDVEVFRPDDQKKAVARRYFTQVEQQYVFREETGWDRRFYEIWTAKESYLKYLGTGLGNKIDAVCVRTLTAPQIITHWMEDACLSLCTEEENYEIQLLQLEAVI